MAITLNHIGIAIDDLPKIRRLFSILQLDVSSSEDVLEQGVRTHFLPLPIAGTNLELLEPMDPQGTVARFIQKKGPGIHHLSFEVGRGELGPLSQRLRAEGFDLVYPEPKAGAHGMRVNFIHPKNSGGILIELMEPG